MTKKLQILAFSFLFWNISFAQTAIRFGPESVAEITIPTISLSDSFTIETTIYLEGNYTEQDILPIVSSGQKTILAVSGNGYFHLGEAIRSTRRIAAKNWLHIAVTYDAGKKETRIYFEGKNFGTITDTAFSVNSTGITLGQAIGGLDFIGNIDNLRIWNTVRSQSEILTNIENCNALANPNLLALYLFDEGSGTEIIDSSGNNHTGSIITEGTSVSAMVATKPLFCRGISKSVF